MIFGLVKSCLFFFSFSYSLVGGVFPLFIYLFIFMTLVIDWEWQKYGWKLIKVRRMISAKAFVKKELVGQQFFWKFGIKIN
jgi:hypothetical protein